MTSNQALAAQLLAMADDELILGHRGSEWTGHAPILEEDIAFSNIAQDEIGHANIWYTLLQDLTGDVPDHLVFFRGPSEYRNVQMVELPRGDWAFSMLRQYLFDAAEAVRLARLVESHYRPLAEAAAKIRTEEIYHYRHTQAWITRLGLGTDESHQRLQTALNALWAFALQMFVPLPGEAELVEQAILPNAARVQAAWLDLVMAHLAAAGLLVPTDGIAKVVQRSEHSPHLAPLLEDMQMVARLEAPGAEW
jgi:ring-1,2-phenylacetyl-CoA epoxidase subunit PaaC